MDRGQTTRQTIIDVATLLFTEAGYEDVSIEAVLKACGISRGALYHHFPSKQAVFAAVLHDAEALVAQRVGRAALDATNPLDQLRLGCGAWLRLAASDVTVRRIVLTDAPTVVGWHAWREIDEQYSLGLLRGALAAAAEAGRMPADRIDLFAHMLLAVLVEMALLIARSPDPATTEAGHAAVELLISSLFGLKPNALWT